MAKINRYTDIRPSQYSPMSLQELMMVPAYKRTQHDQLLEASAGLETELAKVDPLLYHSDLAGQEQERIRKQIEDQVNLLNEEGFTNNSKQRLLDINRDYQKSISPTGIIGKINNAKQVLEANRKAHIDESIKLGNSTEDAVRNWMEFEKQYIDEFNRTGQITPIGQLGAPEYVDYIDESIKLFKDAGFTEKDLAGGMISQLITTDPRGQYVLNTGGGKITKSNITQLQDAVDWLNMNIANPNSNMAQSLAYQGKDPNQVLEEVTKLANVYIEDSQKNDYSSTITGFKSAAELGIGLSGNTAFTATEASNVKRYNTNLSNALDNISKGKMVQVVTESNNNSINSMNAAAFNAIGTTGNSAKFKSQRATVENSLNKDQKQTYDDIYKILVENDNANTLLHDKYSPEVASEVQNYLIKYSDVLRQDIIVQNDIVKTYGDSQGDNSKSVKDIDNYIKRNRINLQYSYDGQEYSYNELPEDIRLQIDDAIYTGYMSPKNFKGFGKESNSDLYVSPHVYTIIDPDTGKGSELLVGRTSGERESKDFKADRLFNDIYQKTINVPLKEIDIEELGINIKYNPENQNTPYILKSKTTNKITAVDDITLQNAIYQAYGVQIKTPDK